MITCFIHGVWMIYGNHMIALFITYGRSETTKQKAVHVNYPFETGRCPRGRFDPTRRTFSFRHRSHGWLPMTDNRHPEFPWNGKGANSGHVPRRTSISPVHLQNYPNPRKMAGLFEQKDPPSLKDYTGPSIEILFLEW